MSELAAIGVTRLTWFVAVAEELHFARAARGLGIARQRLSQSVIDMQAELDVTLFVPGASPTELTDDGRRVLNEARALLAAEPEPAATEQTETLRVGYVPGVTMSKWVRVWNERHPDVHLDIIATAMADQITALQDGRIDMCIARVTTVDPRWHAIPMYREVPVVLAPKNHVISVASDVTLADLADETLHDGSDLEAIEAIVELVAAGVGLVIVPHSIARLYARKDLVYRQVMDVPDTQIALVWSTQEPPALTEEFIGVVRGRTERSSRAASSTPQQASTKKSSSPKRAVASATKRGRGKPAGDKARGGKPSGGGRKPKRR